MDTLLQYTPEEKMEKKNTQVTFTVPLMILHAGILCFPKDTKGGRLSPGEVLSTFWTSSLGEGEEENS